MTGSLFLLDFGEKIVIIMLRFVEETIKRYKKLLSNYRYLQNFANIPGAWRRNRDEKRFFGRYVSPTPTPRHKDRSDDASADSFRRVVHPLAPVLVVAVGDVDGADLVKGLVQRSSIRQTLQGSFAALSKPSFARKILI